VEDAQTSLAVAITPTPAEGQAVKSFPMPEALPGEVVIVCRVEAEGDDGIRLKRLGVCDGRRLVVVQSGDPLIIKVVGCRVGVSRRVARHVIVRPCDACVRKEDADR